ncbi:long-chain-fatty-acid--CoA ligase [Tardiphaga sp. vice352]|uniref:long-chain-fatty-acid--CoA ligase n=1 Tax=unclassified Tardiphaga TaxID=2631404 RepID=UPI0011649A51|nr:MULTISPECIES: long-chain-fatty-acid--CoA ligase [unclassified Tardiphaga]MBC7585748.1 long-chain-fatty-acid--CoA ligase [Tardiphaga sp.]QDM17567.1 long-chain-fatty-acid--CoA ligase [Tardiphaga sp. vice278]QDM22508.1 long-chain-fatty-acid--CoA ligase [Tardiphaga sp. vice154]QDM27796.1 long-chain-fatty-acid--CoA ligase [Tardiphaga sp. vice304]QDM32952.1 long-chain-fatty-acid--CoA ligase [Tardiphaga sp. vice352]
MNITQGLRRALQVNPEGMATIDGERRRTWREVGERVSRLAGALQTLGIGAGDRVAVLMLNSDRYLELYLGIASAGAVVVPTNVRWSHAEIADSLLDCRASALVVDSAFAAMGVDLAKAMPLALIHADDAAGPAGAHDYEQLIRDSEPVADAMRGRDDLAGIFYTGGTTGRSKGVMLSHGNIVVNSLHMLAEGLVPLGTIYLNAAPMFHVANGGAMFALLLSGGTNVIVRVFNPELVLATIAREKVTATLIVPTMIQMLVDHPAFPEADLSSLKQMMYGASPINETLLKRAMAGMPGTEFHQLYGMTELSPLATHLPWDQHFGEAAFAKGRQRACGRAAVGCEVAIVDADRRPVANGVVGEVAVRGANVMMGYWERPEETAKAVIDGWMHTGDGGYRDDEGYIYLVDRMKDMIISGGENVYSIEVENAVAQHPAVAQCAVIGIPDPQWGETVHAFVITKPDHAVNAAEIIAFCRDRIAGYKCPRSVEVRQEPFPLSGAGKVLKRELRKPFWENAGAKQAKAG